MKTSPKLPSPEKRKTFPSSAFERQEKALPIKKFARKVAAAFAAAISGGGIG